MAGDTTNDCTAVMRPGQDPAASAGVTVSPRLLGNVPHEVFSGMWRLMSSPRRTITPRWHGGGIAWDEKPP